MAWCRQQIKVPGPGGEPNIDRPRHTAVQVVARVTIWQRWRRRPEVRSVRGATACGRLERTGIAGPPGPAQVTIREEANDYLLP